MSFGSPIVPGRRYPALAYRNYRLFWIGGVLTNNGGGPSHEPRPVGWTFSDVVGGNYFYSAILAALVYWGITSAMGIREARDFVALVRNRRSQD